MNQSLKKERSFEEGYKQLESIVEALEKGELTLEESLKKFEEGMELVKMCSLKLNNAEARLKELVETEDGEFKLKNFE